MTTDENRITAWKVFLSIFFPYFESSYNIFHSVMGESITLFESLNKESSKELAWERALLAMRFGAKIPEDYLTKIKEEIMDLLAIISVLPPSDQIDEMKDALFRGMISFWGALLIAKETGDQRFIARFSTFESKRFNNIMSLIIKDREILNALSMLDPRNRVSIHALLKYVAEQLDLRTKQFEFSSIQTKKGLGIHFLDYIECAPSRAGSWKLINRVINDGYVLFIIPIEISTKGKDEREFIRLLESAVSRKIKRKIEELNSYESLEVPPWVSELSAKALEYYESIVPKEILIDEGEEYWPPCMRAIIGEIKAGRSLPHQARFAITTFLHAIGWDEEQMLDLYRNFPDFDEEKARYQIKHITGHISGKVYNVPSCETMLSYGYCYREKDPFGLCEKVKHPMQYYQRALKIVNKNRSKKKHVRSFKR
ncbi:MAG: hypothetical protein J7K58_03245 [Euryarchaeota archaeon]|nr:hypothetical protein [Euryarchaeota archaeon]